MYEDVWRVYYEPALALALATDEERATLLEACAAIDIDVEIHPEMREMLVEGEWTAARSRANELGGALREEGFQTDGLKVVAGNSWRGKWQR